MQRLTTDKPVNEMTNMELAFNCCVVDNGQAVYRDYENPIDARKLAMNLLDYYGVEGVTIQTRADLDEFMVDSLLDGPFTSSGLIALLYRFIWSMAEMRTRLKQYEDTGLTPDQLYEMDRLYLEKCKELAEVNHIKERVVGIHDEV